jgi:hypothetical protein
MNRAFPHVYPVDPFPEGALMRSFDDEHGGHWQAALLEASFGNILLIFTRIGGNGVLHRALDTANYHEAEQWLAGAEDAALRTMLETAQPWG